MVSNFCCLLHPHSRLLTLLGGVASPRCFLEKCPRKVNKWSEFLFPSGQPGLQDSSPNLAQPRALRSSGRRNQPGPPQLFCI